jgi:hypothetical protein
VNGLTWTMVPAPVALSVEEESEPKKVKKPGKPRKPRKPTTEPGPHVVYMESKGFLGHRGQWVENLQEAEICKDSRQAKLRARTVFRYQKDKPAMVQVIPVIVFDSPERASWYEATGSKK